MNITTNIPEILLIEAANLSGIKNNNKLVKRALLKLIQVAKVRKIMDFKGRVKLDIDLDSLRDR